MRKFLATLAPVVSPRTADAVITGLLASPWVLLVRQYIFDDWNFVGYLLVLIMVDTALALQHHWRGCSISSRGFSRLFVKAGLYMALLILSHVMTNFQIHGVKNVVFAWFSSFIYCSMMAREALSVLEHVAGIAPEMVPDWLMRRLAQFNANGPAVLAEPAPDSATKQPEEGAIS